MNMNINPVEFGELKGSVNATLANTEKLLEKFDLKLDKHEERIDDLEEHRTVMKKAVKWIGTGISAVIGFIAWAAS